MTVRGDSWRLLAACRGLPWQLFHAEGDECRAPGGTAAYAEGRAVCARCPVQGECLEYALRHAIAFGLWGGMSLKERRGLARRRRSA